MADSPLFERWRLVVFDFDGTIADSQHNIVRIMQHAFRRGEIEPPTAQAVRRRTNIVSKKFQPITAGKRFPTVRVRIFTNRSMLVPARLSLRSTARRCDLGLRRENTCAVFDSRLGITTSPNTS